MTFASKVRQCSSHDGQQLSRIDRLAFPDYCDLPSEVLQLDHVTAIASDIGLELGVPEVETTFGRRASRTACVAMPKATLDLESNLVFREYQIRRAGQILAVEAKPVTKSVGGPPNSKFRLRVLLFDTSHECATASSVDPIGHASQDWAEWPLSTQDTGWRRARMD
jgi:hypothetical protein